MTANQPPQPEDQPPQYGQTPPYPHQPAAPPYGQVPPPYAQPPYPPQPYGQPQYVPYPPQQYAPQWVPAGPPKRKASGLRIAAGVLGLVLGFFLLIEAGPGFAYNAFLALLLLAAALANITAGILLLANQRSATRGAPITSISCAGFALLASLLAIVEPYYGGAPFIIDLLLAAPIIILLGICLSRESRAA